jgi:hypothetical protein
MDDKTTGKPFFFDRPKHHDADLRHYVLWGSLRERGSERGKPTKAALIPGGNIMLMSRGAVERGNLPPGIERLLTEAEFEQLLSGKGEGMQRGGDDGRLPDR